MPTSYDSAQYTGSRWLINTNATRPRKATPSINRTSVEFRNSDLIVPNGTQAANATHRMPGAMYFALKTLQPHIGYFHAKAKAEMLNIVVTVNSNHPI